MSRPTLDHLEDFAIESEAPAPGVALVTARGELDLATAPVLRERLDAAVRSGARALVIDLTPVVFMDSMALAAILHARTALGGRRTLTVVVPEGSYTRMLFEIAGLLPTITLVESVETALALAGAG